MTRPWTSLLFSSLLLALATCAIAGDAVVVGYNQDGIWTAVTYFRSATPKGGKDYRTSEQARESALRDLRRRSQYPATQTSVLSSSDRTGFVAVARGHDQDGRDFHAVGRGKSQSEADRKAFNLLNEAGAGAEEKIIYRYFTYGAHPN